uniref:Uncharacterized protein n=1 Tax=Brassica oleracea TaxID=3712 RepID=A0A3P6DWW4_BRAOL|nr:unnamed protein product [Brassica oleracea]
MRLEPVLTVSFSTLNSSSVVKKTQITLQHCLHGVGIKEVH